MQKLRRYVARHRAAVTVGVASVVALAIIGVVSVRNIVEARRTAEAERALAESARNDAANKGAEVTARLRASYLDRARVELAAHHMDRALALLSEAAALGVDTPAVRLAVARALDELPATWRHLGAVTSVRMVPGTHDVVFTESTGVTRWSPATGQIVWSRAGPAVAVALAAEGTAAVLWRDRIEVVALDDGRSLFDIAPHEGAALVGLNAIAAKRWLAAMTTDGQVDVFDLAHRAKVATVRVSALDHVFGITPDGQRLLLRLGTDFEAMSHVIVRRDGKTLAKLCDLCLHSATTPALVATAGRGGMTGPWTLRVADWSGTVRTQLTPITTSDLRSISMDAETVAVAAEDGSVELWDHAQGTLRWRATIDDQAYLMRYDERGRLWVLGRHGGVHAFDRLTGIELVRLDGTRGSWLDVSDDARAVVTLGVDALEIWPVRPTRAVLRPTPARVTSVDIGRDGSSFLASEDGTLAKLAPGGAELARVTAHTPAIHHVRALEDGAVVTSAPNSLAVWDPATLREERRIPDGQLFEATSDGKTIATASPAGPISLWERATGTQLRTFSASSPLLSIRLSRDGQKVSALSRTGEVSIWNAADGTLLRALGPVPRAFAQSISPDARWLFRCAPEKAPSLIAIGAPPAADRPLEQFPTTELVLGAAFSADGKLLAITGSGFVGVWDVETGRRRMYIDDGVTHTGVALSPDGALVYAASTSRSVGAWEIETSAPVFAAEFPFDTYRLVLAPDASRLIITTVSGAIEIGTASYAGDLAALRSIVACRSRWAVDAGRLVEREIDIARCVRAARPSR